MAASCEAFQRIAKYFGVLRDNSARRIQKLPITRLHVAKAKLRYISRSLSQFLPIFFCEFC